MIGTYAFSETTPAASGTAASSGAVTCSVPGVTCPAGIAQGMPLEEADNLTFYAALVGATGDTLDVYWQDSFDGGTTWVEYAHYTQLTAGASAIKYVFSVSRGSQLVTPTAVGFGNTAVLAGGTVRGGGWGGQFRMRFVAGASTSAGAAITAWIAAGRKVN